MAAASADYDFDTSETTSVHVTTMPSDDEDDVLAVAKTMDSLDVNDKVIFLRWLFYFNNSF